MTRRAVLAASLAAALAAFAPLAAAASEVRLWHAFDRPMAAQLARLVADYNASQDEFHAELLRLDPGRAQKLRRLALPLNTDRPVLYYNRDALRRAKLNPRAAPKTWYDMAGTLGALAQAGQSCGYTTAWPAWVMLENSGGTLSRQIMVRWSAMLATWEKAGYFSYSGRANEAEARFAAGECALLTSSSGVRAELGRHVHFDMGVAPLPYYNDAGIVSRALPAGTPAVWVERPSVGVANFFAFLSGRAARARAERERMEGELEAVWRGEKSALQALEAYSSGAQEK